MNLCTCGNPIDPKRWAMKYRSCLTCGEAAARKIQDKLRQISAPAYNKGAYQPMFTRQDVLDAGRK